MSRSGYDYEGCDTWASLCWRGAVASAIRGARGQAMLREMLDALDALPEKRLAADSLVNEDGEFCALGALGRARGLGMQDIEPTNRRHVARVFGVAEALAAEVMWINDECVPSSGEVVCIEIAGPVRKGEGHKSCVYVEYQVNGLKRWRMVRQWVIDNIKQPEKV
jgi:hypothetical protein